MPIQDLLVVVLAILVIFLAVILIRRIKNEKYEKRQMAAVQQLSPADFSSLLNTNAREGVIGRVAGMVSDLLKESFGCELILFLRKKRGLLKYNYSYGVEISSRYEFDIPYSRKLAEQFRTDYLPREISHLRDMEFMPENVCSRLIELGVDTYFPIFWRDNLYGVYFIRNTLETKSVSFNILIASLAQCLSAAYHIKWHEERQNDLQKKLTELSAKNQKRQTQVSRPSSILKLVRHRDSETIIPEIVNSIKTDLRMDKIVYIYEQDGDATTPLLVTDGVDDSLEVPSESAFEKLRRVLVDGEPRKVNDFSVEYEPLQNWSRDLKRAGLKHLMSFSVSPLRQGIIAWSGGGSVRLVGDRLGLLKNHAGDLVENTLTHERTKEMSYTDNLTGLSNQRFFLKRLEEETARAVRYGRRIALIFFDLDDLKSINDTNGHLAGDAVLRQLGSIFHNSIRSIDVVARYGGDEFCIIMPEADGTICRKFMKRLLSAISRAEFRIDEHDNFSSCTVSAGGAVFPDDGADSMKLIHAADMALLGAKSRGGNKALLYGEYE